MAVKIGVLLILAIGGSALTSDRSTRSEKSAAIGGDATDEIGTIDDPGSNETDGFLNFGLNRGDRRYRVRQSDDPERALQSKVNVLARLLKIHVDRLRDKTDRVELVFLVDSSASVGSENFRSELSFVRKLLSDFTVEPTATRVSLVTFAGKRHIRRHIDQISRPSGSDHKCHLLNRQLDNITYTGGGTYTRGALLEALVILQNSREDSEKVVFLITDGFSNSGDPRPAAALLKEIGATIFTFGIRTGNVEELHDIASEPGYTHSYLLDSFPEFEALARRALHRDLKAGRYVPVKVPSDCDWLCSPNNGSEEAKQCCDDLATCACGTATGHYACLCPRGYFGSGLRGFCQPCPNGTFDQGGSPGDSPTPCSPCPNVNHVTTKVPATSADDCVCAQGFITDGDNCEAIRCPKLKVPENGYFVKASACSNVVNAACGLRCRIGFNLIGDSIRLCRIDGAWSGTEPQCLLKTCAVLKAPTHGRIRCEHEEDDVDDDEDDERKINDEELTAYPIDTRCQFKCDVGYQLRGSKVRNCLPLSRWDGLKVTCKQIKCEPLRRLANGKINPETCTGSKRLPFSTNCTFSCDEGFVLKGPKNRHCSGKSGIWSQRHSVSQCIDKTPPVIKCPADSTWETLPGKNYALAKWQTPTASDNANRIPNVWSKPHVTQPWKAKIGSHRIVYVAQDAAGNRAKCKFVVRVVDKEPPTVENCVNPPTFLTVKPNGEERVTWIEPIFYDNSQRPVTVAKSHSSPECDCPVGQTQVFYNATDAFGNSASCVVNVTIEDACKDIPVLSNGQANCQTLGGQSVRCVVTCEDGYGFAVDQPDTLEPGDSVILTCGLNETVWNGTFFPDCSATVIPNSVGRDGSVILQGDTSVCDNSTSLRWLGEQITGDLASNMIDVCGNDIDCSLVKLADPKCEEEIAEIEEIDTNVLGRRRRRSGDFRSSNEPMKPKSKTRVKRKRGKIEIKFRFVGKIVAQYRNNPELGIRKLREKIQAMTASGQLNLFNDKTSREIAKLALNLNTVFKDARELCEAGYVLKKHNCTKCPMGTFHNKTRDQCEACYFGEYQDSAGSSKCIRCPENTFTRKKHSKNLFNCQPTCRPGYFSRQKANQVSSVGLEPCATCEIGHYQPDYGKMHCQPCPANKTTIGRGATSADDCVPATIEDPCATSPCLNGGRCTSENSIFSCECSDHYVGSTCEKFEDPCESQPCLNEGECRVTHDPTPFYNCSCKTGFTGPTCETYIDECAANPCQNGGSCMSTEKDYSCACRDGFEGEFCETTLDHCEPSACDSGSTCVTIAGTWKCLCRPGYLGLRCNLLPCDWIPCHANSTCVNLQSANVTRESFICVCPDGYEGDDCGQRIDHCKNSPCLNSANCVNGFFNHTCECPPGFTGANCETELSADYLLHFREAGTNDYVIFPGPKKDLSALTVCVWLQSVDTFNYGTVLSYATKNEDNAFTLTDYNGFVVYVNGEKVVTDVKVNDGRWHFLCVDWSGSRGAWHVYVDGVLRDNDTLLAPGSVVQSGGFFVVGQEQDQLGGGFSASEAFLGKLGLLDVWDEVLDPETVKNFSDTCDDYRGSVVAWAEMRLHIRGAVSVVDSNFCRGCQTPATPAKGYIVVDDDGAAVNYHCDAGYSVRVGNWIGTSHRRKCMKHGMWEGYHEPVCTKVKCGFPGYFPRGRVHGRSFAYGDEIRYSCAEGYELRGNPHRVCNADGNWSGMQPICIGVTCKNLLAPENGDIEYVIEEHERDDISILQVGQQLEFKCNPGFRLSGERYLTCLGSGKWDFQRPKCRPSGCPAPKLLQRVYISSNESSTLAEDEKLETPEVLDGEPSSSNDSSTMIYGFGDVVVLSCDDGFKFNGSRDSSAEFRLECATSGTWTGSAPDCVRLRCPSLPEDVENARLVVVVASDDEAEHENSPQRKIDDSPVDAESLVTGTKISIVCDRGYELTGEATRICLDNEEWSPNEAKCERIRCPIEEHPVVGLLAEMINDSAIIANNDFPTIVENSPEIRGTYGEMSFLYGGNYYGDEVAFECEKDEHLILATLGTEEEVGNLTWKCNEEGKWRNVNEALNESIVEKILTDKSHICEGITCGPPQIPSNGYVVNASNTTEEMTTRAVNSTVTFRCRSGFLLQGSEIAECLTSGIWSTVPSCKPVSCKNPPKVANAVLEETSSEIEDYVFGNMIIYRCVPGYRIFGQGNARCLANGKWSRIHGKCSKISCGKPKIPPGVTVSGRSYLFQEKLTYKCPDGGPKGSISCKSDGKWSDPPVCTAKQR